MTPSNFPRAAGLAFGLLATWASPSFADSTDIAAEPLITMSEVAAKPNIMFILDDSGSMDSKYMPDDMSGTGYYGYYSSQCNGVAYDPTVVYTVPPNNSFPTPTFRAAYADAYTSTTGTVDLQTGGDFSGGYSYVTTSNKIYPAVTGSKTFTVTGSSGTALSSNIFVVGNTVVITSGGYTMVGTVTSWTYNSNTSASLVVNVTSTTATNSSYYYYYAYIYPGSYYYSYSGSQTAMGWTYSSTGSKVTTSTFYKECTSSIGSSPGSAVFTKVYVSATSSDAANYAIWYSYYRSRMNLMRSAVGKAFDELDDNYRIGFTTISNTSVTTSGTSFRDVKDFGTTQKANFYSSLYKSDPNSSTYLRRTLSMVGRYFAKKYTSQTYDPMEYACQRNFAILSTDGYWNDSDSTALMLDGSTKVGNQDAAEKRPLYDGTTTTRNQYVVSTKYTASATCGTTTCNKNYYCVTTTPQTYSIDSSDWSNGTVTYACKTATDTLSINGTNTAVSSLAGTTAYGTTSTSGGSSNSLADVAEYYYVTDLRTTALGNCSSSTSGSSQDVCSNIITAANRDTATWQHMTTFTIGLGTSGYLTYDKNYLTQTSGDYVNLTNGTKNWPVPSSAGNALNIDDLWHAAVDGRGQYFSALNASALAEAISTVVTTIQSTVGSASTVATNTQDLVSGSNYAYKAGYTTVAWYGDLQAYALTNSSGAVSSTASWSAQTLLDSATAADRTIYFNKSGTLTSFLYSNLPAAQQAYFSGMCSKTVVATQCSSLSTTNLALANSGSNLVDYLRGTRTYEASNTTSPLFRTRTHVLGDIINSSPVYVGAPSFSYTDTGYANFVTANASRTGVLYVGANDGMLHAFNASTGAEKWAFVPTAVMSNMYKLANTSYATAHTYFVDGTVVVGDIYVNNAWKTILVGGLNGGGAGYYALDITTPDSPKLLWEFTDANLGLSYGNPIIAKQKDGTWVVALTSGYNNTSGDGDGHFYVLNANTGATVHDISTGVGSKTTPSGLGMINGWIDNSRDNTALRFYGGDMLGNLWRFDIDSRYKPYLSALQLAEFQTSDGTVQPITVKPRLKLLSSSYPVVFVGTGRYLGTSDIDDTTTQSIAALKDPLTNTSYGVVRDSGSLVNQVYTISGSSATSTSNTVTWSSQGGWWVDLPQSGERVVGNNTVQILANLLYVATAIPNGDACSSGGTSWLYGINLLNGQLSWGDLYSSTALIVGMSIVVDSNGNTVVVISDSGGGVGEKDGGGGGDSDLGTPRRTSWRELSN